MTDYNDGKIHGWNGGDCPVHPESVVEFWMRGGSTMEDEAGIARWVHIKTGGDIIAFRVVKQHVEPKAIWVNEAKDGTCYYYPTEDRAKQCAGHGMVRIAVEYREVKK